jgi:hypothetical protein
MHYSYSHTRPFSYTFAVFLAASLYLRLTAAHLQHVTASVNPRNQIDENIRIASHAEKCGHRKFDCTQCRMRRATQRVIMRNGRLIARLLLQSKKLSGEAQSACTALWRKETKVKDM